MSLRGVRGGSARGGERGLGRARGGAPRTWRSASPPPPSRRCWRRWRASWRATPASTAWRSTSRTAGGRARSRCGWLGAERGLRERLAHALLVRHGICPARYDLWSQGANAAASTRAPKASSTGTRTAPPAAPSRRWSSPSRRCPRRQWGRLPAAHRMRVVGAAPALLAARAEAEAQSGLHAPGGHAHGDPAALAWRVRWRYQRVCCQPIALRRRRRRRTV